MSNEQNNFLINLSALYRNTQKYFDKVLAQYEIGSGQLAFLFFINENEGITMQEISRVVEVDKGTTTKSIQKLIEQGYVVSQPDPNDRRIKHLHTTTKAAGIMTPLYEYRNELRRKLGTDVDLDTFEKMLDKVTVNSRLYLVPEPRYEGIRIGGLQKMTLLDYPGLVACTVFTSGCTFKCPFCHNKELVFIPENYDFFKPEDVMAYLKKRQGLLDGVCISGGEPLMQESLEEFLEPIKDMGYKIKLDTNGYEPDRLEELIDTGLVDCVAMDIKNSEEKYARTAGLNAENFDFSRIRKSIATIMNSGIDYEFRTTVVKELHTQDDIVACARLIKGAEAYYLQQYVESENVIQPGWSAYNAEEMEELRQAASEIIPNTRLRGVKEI